MTTERRFSDDEVAYILERAAAADPTSGDDTQALTTTDRAASAGMTVAQLQEIAAEVGLSAAAIADAARAVERGDLHPTQRRTYLGMPIGVGRTIQFDREVTDAEWERMVVALRETFQARGKTAREGTLRSWSNGNLHAMLEPTATGHRLRLQTRNEGMLGLLALGVGTLGISGIMATMFAMSNLPRHTQQPLVIPAIFAVFGLAAIVRTAVRLPSWARERAGQMERFADTASRILRESSATALPAASSTAASSTAASSRNP
jgi:hypothetical protein